MCNERWALHVIIQIAQLSQRDRAAGLVSFGQKWKTGTGIQYSADIIGLSSTLSNSVKESKIRAITPFRVIQGHRGWYQSKARMSCDFLLVINSN